MNLERNKKTLLEEARHVNPEFVKRELDWICDKLEINMKRFQKNFPSACSEAGRYRIKGNDDWTNGFWTGMLWMAYLHTGKEAYSQLALANVESFQKRLKDHFVLDHHDIGFLYSPSVVAGYRITGDQSLEDTIIRAADCLADRFQEKGGFIQAWGALDCDKEYRLIIDSLLNLPLLYEASEISGNPWYAKLADTHYDQVLLNIVRPDDSTYHTFYFDPTTGDPSHGATHQGFRDDSCWARGQSWAILGIPLHVRKRGGAGEKAQYGRIVDYFLDLLSKEGIPYWDLIFTEWDRQPYDSSALAIAACGLMEAKQAGYYEQAEELAKGMVAVLAKNCTSRQEEAEGILLHGVYAYSEGKGVDQANLWGDYYYMEALLRLKKPDWETFW